MHVQVGMDPETDRRLTNQSLLCISTQFVPGIAVLRRSVAGK
jgi:hypothetical protein